MSDISSNDYKYGDYVVADVPYGLYWDSNNMSGKHSEILLANFPYFFDIDREKFRVIASFAYKDELLLEWTENPDVIFTAHKKYFKRIESALKKDCECSIEQVSWHGCKCGAFEEEMKSSGRNYNKWTRNWE